MDIDDKLNEATAQLAQSLSGRSVPDLERPRSLARIVIPALAIAAMFAVATIVLVTGNNSPAPITAPTSTAPSTTSASPTTTTVAPATTQAPPTTEALPIPATGPLFGEETGDVLVFDDGLKGVLALDVDARLGARTTIEGQRASDGPHRLHRVGDDLIVGWSSIYAYSLQTGESRQIDFGTFFVPAAEPDRIWIVDGAQRVWQVDPNGNVLTDPTEIGGDVYPMIGIPGGLALQTEHGIALWYPETGQSETTIGTGASGVIDTWGNLMAYCLTNECEQIEVVDLGTGAVVAKARNPLTTAENPHRPSGRFSPDGTMLATNNRTGDIAYFAVEPAPVAIAVSEETESEFLYMAWSSDSRAIYAAEYTYQTGSITIIRHDLDTLETAVATLPIGGTLDFVVLDRDEADRLLVDPFNL